MSFVTTVLFGALLSTTTILTCLVQVVILATAGPFVSRRRLRRATSSVFLLSIRACVLAHPFLHARVTPNSWRIPARVGSGELAVLFVFNHRSNFDLFAICGSPSGRGLACAKLVGKADVFRIPFFGWALWLADRALPVHFDPRKHGGWGTVPGSTRLLLKAAEEALLSGQSVGMAPEGARMGISQVMKAVATDHTGLMPFKLPFFELARRLGVPVVPVAIHGADDILPVGSFWMRPGTTTVHFAAPIYGADYESDHAFADAVRSSVGRSYKWLCSK